MRNLKTSLLAIILIISLLQATAQSTPPLNQPNYNKTKIFNDLPEKFKVNLNNLENLFNLPVGTAINTTAAPSFPLIGIIMSKSNPTDQQVKSVVIKTSTRQNAIFTFTRLTAIDGSVKYIGRMMGQQAGDALQIIREGDHYVFRKQGFYELLNE